MFLPLHMFNFPAWFGEHFLCYADKTLSQVFLQFIPLEPEVPTSENTPHHLYKDQPVNAIWRKMFS
jgi:hypothetical protein